ncbi:hypothetical protein EC973_001031 [Apophysomyces ossiformis]|uniref:C2H2-type domain-containing protein n=1 Tax=Apophysomyces ossiformis TaxID=679940 RepID=A0A8H7BUJ0_9FUNG|nr:hypothetical protein EC973_001031 [Apophysomyces ossiformis]
MDHQHPNPCKPPFQHNDPDVTLITAVYNSLESFRQEIANHHYAVYRLKEACDKMLLRISALASDTDEVAMQPSDCSRSFLPDDTPADLQQLLQITQAPSTASFFIHEHINPALVGNWSVNGSVIDEHLFQPCVQYQASEPAPQKSSSTVAGTSRAGSSQPNSAERDQTPALTYCSTPAIARERTPSIAQSLRCIPCNKVYGSKGILKRHQLSKKHHKALRSKLPLGLTRYKCQECNKSFGRKDTMVRHMKHAHVASMVRDPERSPFQ